MTDSSKSKRRAELLERFRQGFAEMIPHNRALGLQFEDFEAGAAIIRLPYSAKLVGNPETGVLHGGAITALMDATCGASVFIKRGTPGRIATLDLRIDYLRKSPPQKDVWARAECFKLTRSVAFVRCLAHNGDPEDPVASGAGAFMQFDSGSIGVVGNAG